jgi:RNA polymerase sigma factor (sigma-70 family)
MRWAKIRDLPDDQRVVRLKAIARNKAIDTYRRRQTAQSKQHEITLAHQAGSCGTYQAAMTRIAVSELWAAVHELPPRQVLVAVMRFHDQMTGAAIARELKLSAGTVSKEIKAVRGVMREIAERYVELDELG